MKNKALRLLVALAVVAPVVSQAAVQLPAGTQELGVQGYAKLGSGWDVNVSGSYGKFIRDNWEVGGTTNVQVQDRNDALSLRVGIFTEYNFINTTNWVPYVGAATELGGLSLTNEAGTGGNADADLGTKGDSWALNVKLAGGVKYFVNKNVALTAEVNYNIATDKIFSGSTYSTDAAKKSLTNIVFGTRFYF